LKKFFRRLVYALLFYWAFNFIINLYRSVELLPLDCIEISQLDSISGDYLHSRTWKNYQGSLTSCMHFRSNYASATNSNSYRNAFPHPRYNDEKYEAYWGKVYRQLSSEQSDVLYQIKDSLSNIMIKEGLDAYQTADLLVTFIQDIPYTLIKSDDCTEEDEDSCVGNQKFGLLTPTEFMYQLKGDCDTRAVFLFKLLGDFGYDPLIVVSKEYRHAMIAINLPTAGDFIEHEGIRYYFWETTAKGWQSGMLPPSYPNVNYWEVALSL
jgi:hypothetical protein